MPAKMVVGAFTPSVLLRVARSGGWLAEHHLDVEEVLVPSSPAQFRALLDGDLHAVFTNPDNVVAYRFWPDNPLGRTADVTVVSGIDRGLGLGLYARPGSELARLREAATLRMAVDVPTSGFAFVLYALAESFGMSREDYEVMALGSTPTRLAMLLEGQCDATMLNAGNELRAEAAGCPLLGRVRDVVSPYLGTVLAVAGNAHLGRARRLTRALASTAGRILDGTLDDLTADQAQAALDLDPVLARRYVAGLKDPRNGLVRDGVVGRRELAAVVGLRRRYQSGAVRWLDDVMAADSGLVTM